MPPRQTRKKNASKSPEKPAKTASKEKKTEKKETKKKEEDTYVVEAILDKAKMKGLMRYKVKWLGYPEEDCTWEPLKNLESVKEMVNEFNAAYKKKEDAEKEEDEEEEGKKKDLKKMSGEKEDEDEEEAEEEKEKTKSKGKGKSQSETPLKKAEPKPRSTKNTRRRNIETEPLAPGEAPVKKLKSDKALPPVTFGHFEFDDVPEKITKVVKGADTIVFTIKWNPRPDGFTPNPTEMTNLELRHYNKDLLLDFYEQRLKFVNASAHKNQTIKSPDHQEVGRIIDKPPSPISIDDEAPEAQEPLNKKIDFVAEAEKKALSIEEEVLEDVEGKKPERMEEERIEEPKQSDVVEIEEEKVVPEENKPTEENIIPEEEENAIPEEPRINEEIQEKEVEHKEPGPIEIEEEAVPVEPEAADEPIAVEEETAENKENEVVNVEAEEIKDAEEIVETIEITERIVQTQDSKIQETQVIVTQEVVSNPIETAASPAKSDSSTPNLFNYDPNLQE